MHRSQHVKDVTFWDPHDTTFYNPMTYINKRKFTEITLAGNDYEDKIKLDFGQLTIRELIKSNDTTTGVHLKFKKGTKYWAWVRALDICEIENAKTYLTVQNNLWVINLHKANELNEQHSTFIRL